MPSSLIPEPINSTIGPLARFARRLNMLIKFASVVNNMKGTNGIVVTITDENMVISGEEISGGGGLPSGYGPEEFTICVNGSPALRNFLTDNPD